MGRQLEEKWNTARNTRLGTHYDLDDESIWSNRIFRSLRLEVSGAGGSKRDGHPPFIIGLKTADSRS